MSVYYERERIIEILFALQRFVRYLKFRNIVGAALPGVRHAKQLWVQSSNYEPQPPQRKPVLNQHFGDLLNRLR